MPTLTRYFIKFALAYLAAALLIGAILAARSLWRLPPLLSTLGPVYFHAFLVGWVTQLIFGVAYWMFPILNQTRPRGSEKLGWTTFILLNVGLAMRVIVEPLHGLRPHPLSGWLLVLSALLQWAAGLIFVLNTWNRVKPSARELRSKQSE
ncbi:MAG: hypothetical protein KJ063_12325 [Anaerolineae bacterium]|nr:hypothetical protein [Anaerolineae bacterium]